MKIIGREVLFLKSKGNNPRNGEGTFIRLNNGGILFAYSRFTGKDWFDECAADIAAITSYDEGETWREERILFEHDENSRNYMCPNLLRMNNGDIGLIYLRKDRHSENSAAYIARSSDEGKSFSTPQRIGNDYENYFVVENDHVIRLSSGRIIMPANIHSEKINGKIEVLEHGYKCIFASDDDGLTWNEIAQRQDTPFPKQSETGLQETYVFEEKSGRLRAFSRTDLGFQFECFSEDGGKTWSEPKPNRFFSSPDSPLIMRNVGSHTVAIFNPIPNYVIRPEDNTWGRTPLVCAVSDDNGKSFEKIFALEDDPDNGYCYPAVIDGEGYFLVAYYHSDNSECPLNACRIKKILFSEIG